MLPQEQPPVEEPRRLREWLSRMMLLINGALSNKDNLEPTGQMPAHVSDGMTKYFSTAVEPDILYPGPWMYVEGEWVSLNARRAVRLVGRHVPDQVPTGLDVPMQIQFGDAQISQDGGVSLGDDGTLTFLKKCIIDITLLTHYVRTNSNNECFIIYDSTFNGQVAHQSLIRSISSSGEPEGFEISFSFSGLPGDEIKFWMTRDPEGRNDGLLRTFYPTNPIHAYGYGASIIVVREV